MQLEGWQDFRAEYYWDSSRLWGGVLLGWCRIWERGGLWEDKGLSMVLELASVFLRRNTEKAFKSFRKIELIWITN